MILDSASIAAALGRIPSGCAIITAEHAGRSTGALVSWFQQASFQPPCVTVCLKQGRPVTSLIDAGGRFVLNVLGEDPTAMFRHFGRGFGLEEDAFRRIAHDTSEYGPVLTEAVAVLACRLAGKHTVGDHDLYVGEVATARPAGGHKPYVHLRKSGLTY